MQLFIGNDCTEGFLCNSEIDNFLFDGCIKKCQQNQDSYYTIVNFSAVVLNKMKTISV